ncbi:MAG: hypothetical protein QOG64_1749 [Acidimicrobiaceae bacterium]|nr:hypothetical protein [Acidimicrobiaceae bacterium]
MAGRDWIALGVLLLVLAGIVLLAERRTRRYNRRLKSWRWDDIAKWKRGMGVLERSLIVIGRRVSWLSIPLALAGVAALAIGASALLS